MVDFPTPEQVPEWRAGDFEWVWTASFEAFGSDIAQHDLEGVRRRTTPRGTYRFVVRGLHRPSQGAEGEPYTLRSDAFRVEPWRGVRLGDLRVDGDGRVSFADPRIEYPETYESPFRWITGEKQTVRGEVYCRRCTFRPWADRGRLDEVYVTVRKAQGRPDKVRARRTASGRWETVEPIKRGSTAFVDAGDARDELDNENAERSDTVTRPKR
jgi:hypothetical protein